MADSESIEPKEERQLKSKELEMRIQHYKHYITISLQANVFFYVTTGGVLAFYLKYTNETPIPNVEFFLLLPILFGSFLGGIFFYGAWLQTKAVENLDDVRDELRNRLGLSIRKFHDPPLLVILLWFFGFIFFLVVGALLILPFLLGRVIFLKSPMLATLTEFPKIQLFYLAAIIILIVGLLLPFIAYLLDRYLKKRRNSNWLRTILRTKSWLEADKSKELDISELEGKYFFYALRPFLDKETLENIESVDKKKRKFAKILLAAEIVNFFEKLRRKEVLKEKTFKKIAAEVKLEEKLQNSRSRREKIRLLAKYHLYKRILIFLGLEQDKTSRRTSAEKQNPRLEQDKTIGKKSDERQKLIDFMTSWNDALNKHNTVALKQMPPDSLTQTFLEGRVHLKDDYLNSFETSDADFTINHSDYEVSIYDQMAIVRPLKTMDGNETQSRYTTVFIKRKGRWEFVAFSQ